MIFTICLLKVPVGCLQIQTTTKTYGSDNSWSLGPCTSNRSYGNNQVYEQNCCMSNGNYSLTCKDSYKDGWHGGYIEIEGNRYCESFRSGHEKKVMVQVTTGIEENK